MSQKYLLDKSNLILLRDLNLSPQDILRQAHLPLDLMSRKTPMLTAEEYLRLWGGIAHFMQADPAFPLRFGQAVSPESFSPAVFACFCSENLNIAFKRLAYYKPLVAPIRLTVQQNSTATTVVLSSLSEDGPLPESILAMELVYLTQIVRLATRDRIVPKAVQVAFDLTPRAAYEDYFGMQITRGDCSSVSFTAQDAAKPFLTASDEMWSIFEPKLNKRMKDLEQDAQFRNRVRACLMEILASGEYAMNDVATRLAVSPRTLQRRLRAEETSFQKELDGLREELARNYLSRSDYTSAQIAFLLGYEDPNSFFRAFRSWTGQTPEHVRASTQ